MLCVMFLAERQVGVHRFGRHRFLDTEFSEALFDLNIGRIGLSHLPIHLQGIACPPGFLEQLTEGRVVADRTADQPSLGIQVS
jgi:hypothetical protein